MTDWTSIVRAVADPRGKKPNPKIVAMIADHADEQFGRWGITTIRRRAALLAHICVETANFTKLEEDLDYSAERLTEVWPKRFPTIASAEPFAHNPRELANKVYGGRMGNRPGTNDGYDNRGKGPLQCTGHDNCAALGKKLGVSAEVASSWLIHPDHALECACALFVLLGVLPSADAGDVPAQTRRINGGANGLAEREAAYPRAMRALAREAARKSVAAPVVTTAALATVGIVEGDVAAPAAVVDDDPPPIHEVLADLRAAGSRTIANAETIKGVAKTVLGIEGADAATRADGAMQQAQEAYAGWLHGVDLLELLRTYWPLIAGLVLAIIIAYVAWRAIRAADRIIAARVEDARLGLNVGR
jgi:putative chitinase